MIFLSSDHAGFPLKVEIIKYLSEKNIPYEEFGCLDGERTDYPNAATAACTALLKTPGEHFAVLLCGTGIGISMAANKIKGIRAALVHDSYTAAMSRRHNDANVLCMGARVIGGGVALEALEIFLNEKFEGGRHADRVQMIAKIEK
ncbi:MAG: ribose 5-phosphate isomerase B [Ruminococcus sp.]|jgi:ribose 5-phosphate isomerase B|nr:ribose 5-phosphate isomerase B [Ruminococcus sp.]